MRTYRYPALVWRDPLGQFTASLVERDLFAIGSSRENALAQIKEMLQWYYQEEEWLPEPDFREPQLVPCKVPVRPEYRQEERIFPCDDTIGLHVYVVRGRQQGGLYVAALPTLGIRFYYYDEQALRGLVARYVQQKLQGLTPRALSAFLPPETPKLEDVVIHLPRKERQHQSTLRLPILNAVAQNLGKRAMRRQYGRAWERERELQDIVARLSKGQNNLLVVGESGVGKTTLLTEAALFVERLPRSAEDEEIEPGMRFWLTSGARLIAGMQYLGQWEERCERLIAELNQIQGVLCVENLLELVRAGSGNPNSSVAAFLAPYVQRGELRLISEATPDELDACRRLLPGFVESLTICQLAPFSTKSALAILDRILTTHKQNSNLEVGREVAGLIYRLRRRFLPYQAFPGKVGVFIDELFDHARSKGQVDANTVVQRFIHHTGLPELFLRDEIALKYEDVYNSFRDQVMGQDHACQAAAHLVTLFKAGLNDPRRPVGVLLFCGPTGVGKTELAKAIARYFFGHGEQPDRLIRLDMSEFSGPDAASRLRGDPQGEPSELIKKVRAQPFLVLLLDEIEKAAAPVYDVLLSVFDEGRLTDNYGRTTVFRGAIIILTSNLGSDRQASLGFGGGPVTTFDSAVQKFFRPEFYNRLDAVVTFAPLTPETIRAIARKELAALGEREGLIRRGLRLRWADALVEHLAQVGFDEQYGARPLQRTLERWVVGPLARHLLSHTPHGDGELWLDIADDGAISFRHV